MGLSPEDGVQNPTVASFSYSFGPVAAIKYPRDLIRSTIRLLAKEVR